MVNVHAFRCEFIYFGEGLQSDAFPEYEWVNSTYFSFWLVVCLKYYQSMAGNANLRAADKAQNDEFYTQYADIHKEVNAYIEYNPDVLRGQTILLHYDDLE